ncbi:MAG TPA: efflux RND transporter permease subunit [Bacteroidales bacterium]|nr:efflux RND transporter permease subunit [Bacteroidales bacterium]
MVRFLLNKPISVTMTFLALLALGVVALLRLPVSLMPDVDIPKITVQINAANLSARELENAVVSSFRIQLMQVAHLADLKSETRDGSSVIRLDFDYGSNIDYAFIEVNEKIDRVMASMPAGIERPRVIKASATDIPVFYLDLTLKNKSKPVDKGNSTKSDLTEFYRLSNFADQVIRKRIEQLPQVAIADISGQVFSEILIIPDKSKLDGLEISYADIENALNENNITSGNLLIRDGQYQYNVRFGNELRTKEDIANIYLKNKDRLIQVKDIAEVKEQPRKRKGEVISDGDNAITMAIIKQSDARMNDLKKEVKKLISILRTDYPDINFNISRDQTQLLDFSMRNLGQSLYFGAFLAFIVMFLFLKNVRSPWLVGVTLPAALIISLLFFHLAGLTLNVISLAGLVLGISVMTDNSIVVIDNISQHRERGSTLDESCIRGTNEVIRPMLSAVLTTCAVYIPLIFISGITGALFYDQAIAITISQFVSLFIGITILPVYYKIMFKDGKTGEMTGFLKKVNDLDYGRLYEKGFKFVMRHQVFSTGSVIGMLVLAGFLFVSLQKTKLPAIVKDETILRIDWNDRINIDENYRRVNQLLAGIENKMAHNTCIIGEQQFLLDHNSPEAASEALVYIKATRSDALDSIFKSISGFLKENYRMASFNFEDAGNIFDQLFGENQAPLEVRLRFTADFGPMANTRLNNTVSSLQEAFPGYNINNIVWQEQMVLKTDPARMALYEVSYGQVFSALKRSFSENQVLLVADNQNFIPVIIGDKQQDIHRIIDGLSVMNNKKIEIPLKSLISQTTGNDLKTIVAGQEGEYYPVAMNVPSKEIRKTQKSIINQLSKDGHFEAGFSGSYFSNRNLIKQLTVIFIISLALLYFILASQFESLTLPLIVLMEIPVDLFGAFLFLKLFGDGINLMSMIGIVVMSGVVINDSILKVDTFNQLMNEGYPLLKALMVGGQRRLKPIVMTALTAILALLPLLFFGGMGADLQRPMALTIIGGMIVGTIVSLFMVPLGYYYLRK